MFPWLQVMFKKKNCQTVEQCLVTHDSSPIITNIRKWGNWCQSTCKIPSLSYLQNKTQPVACISKVTRSQGDCEFRVVWPKSIYIRIHLYVNTWRFLRFFHKSRSPNTIRDGRLHISVGLQQKGGTTKEELPLKNNEKHVIYHSISPLSRIFWKEPTMKKNRKP